MSQRPERRSQAAVPARVCRRGGGHNGCFGHGCLGEEERRLMYVRNMLFWFGGLTFGVVVAGCSSSSGSQGETATVTTVDSPAPSATPTPNPPGTGVGPGGGTVSDLRFAIVGDTRPSLPDGLAS